MRSGKLLAEESPTALLSMYNAQSLEEVFLKLSRKQEQDTKISPSHIQKNNEKFSKGLAENGEIELEVNHTTNVSTHPDIQSY